MGMCSQTNRPEMNLLNDLLIHYKHERKYIEFYITDENLN